VRNATQMLLGILLSAAQVEHCAWITGATPLLISLLQNNWDCGMQMLQIRGMHSILHAA
jgi:hypothetical protein